MYVCSEHFKNPVRSSASVKLNAQKGVSILYSCRCTVVSMAANTGSACSKGKSLGACDTFVFIEHSWQWS